MTHLTKDFQNHSSLPGLPGCPGRPGLYCVWAPLHDDGKGPLISIWIDPRMTALEPEPLQEGSGLAEASEEVLTEDAEDPKRRIAIAAS
ncbi:MAG TPA: hypothetical protein VMG82_27395 [Candidatus Sulfotelmatobacter sp.]|nr:hypothetical protein [Candidatus Sulfotelmatobacter sp.]